MARDYTRLPDTMYLQMHELQPPQQPTHYHHLQHHHQQQPYHHLGPSALAAPPYELTATAAAAAAAEEAGGGAGEQQHTPYHASSHLAQDHKKRKSQHFMAESGSGYSDMSCDSLMHPAPAPPTPSSASDTRKRKSSIGTNSSLCEDDFHDDSRSTRSLPDKKQNHSEIEKRRRDKMNTYITELSTMVPMCGAMARKLDKLTVLRMAVQHLRGVRGALDAGPLTAPHRPPFLSEREVNCQIVGAAHDSFLLVVGCDRGRLLYVSTSVELMLHYDQSELVGQSLFDLLHPKDVAKVKEQLSSSDLSPRERLIDAKTMLPLKADPVTAASRLCPGARRSFFCRIKCRGAQHVKEEPKVRKKQSCDRKYAVVQCTGYLKSWTPSAADTGGGEGGGGDVEVSDDGDASSMSCLVAVGRALPDLQPPSRLAAHRPLQFVARHATDGKFLFVDQRVTLALGFLPQELVGTSLYEYVSGAAGVGGVARAHKAALLRRVPLHTPPYHFRKKDGTEATITTHFKPFRNPWTKDVECLVANNTLVSEEEGSTQPDNQQTAFDLFKHEPDLEMQRLIDSQLESHKIGSAIAEEALRRSSPIFSPDLPPDLLHDVYNQQPSLVDSILCGEVPTYNNSSSQVRNNVALSSAAAPAEGGERSPPRAVSPDRRRRGDSVSPPLPPLGLDGNGEATMAVIMSLLEADAGLGGPVNFSSLPWPLP